MSSASHSPLLEQEPPLPSSIVHPRLSVTGWQPVVGSVQVWQRLQMPQPVAGRHMPVSLAQVPGWPISVLQLRLSLTGRHSGAAGSEPSS